MNFIAVVARSRNQQIVSFVERRLKKIQICAWNFLARDNQLKYVTKLGQKHQKIYSMPEIIWRKKERI